MNSFRLARIIGLIDDDIVEESSDVPMVKKIHWLRYTALAACLCVVFLGIWQLTHIRMGSAAPSAADPAEAPAADAPLGVGAAVEGTTDGSTVYMAYEGPVLPLTLAVEGVTAERDILYDFDQNTDADGYTGKSSVTDSYVLTNSTSEDIECTALYPFASSLYSLESNTPEITVDGHSVETALLAGGYTGSFSGAGDEKTTSMNLEGVQSWEGYASVLSDGSYLAAALADLPEIDEKVVVYHVTNGTPPEEYNAATVCMSFDYEGEKTRIFTFDMNGYGYDDSTGQAQYSYSANEWNKNSAYLVVIGEDIENYTLQGYENGGCCAGQEIDFEYTAERTEMTLGEFLHFAVRQQCETLETMYGHDGNVTVPDDGIYYRAVVDLWLSYGPMGESPAERYSMGGRIDDLIDDVHVMNRVCYASVKITIPAGGSVTLAAKQSKPASHNFFTGDPADTAFVGYDMLMTAGSSLEFTKVTAGVETYGCVAVENQNMGFDPENGVDSVELDPGTEHYYIEVGKKDG